MDYIQGAGNKQRQVEIGASTIILFKDHSTSLLQKKRWIAILTLVSSCRGFYLRDRVILPNQVWSNVPSNGQDPRQW